MKNYVGVYVLCALLMMVAGVEDDSSYPQKAVELHNEYRGKHGANPLTSNEDLNRRAYECADYYLAKMVFDMSCPFKTSTGENLYAIGGGHTNMTAASVTQRAIESWYAKSSNYVFGKRGLQSKTGQFTQLVWKGSRELGFGVALGNGVAVAIALYSPPGNIIGHFVENVGGLN